MELRIEVSGMSDLVLESLLFLFLCLPLGINAFLGTLLVFDLCLSLVFFGLHVSQLWPFHTLLQCPTCLEM